MEKTTAEKRKETLERNRETKRKAKELREAEERRDRELAKAAMRAILSDPNATPEQKLDAVEILDNLTHSNIIPYSLQEQRKRPPADMESFRAEYEKRLAEQSL